jgi:hypothetical protein
MLNDKKMSDQGGYYVNDYYGNGYGCGYGLGC